MCLKGLNAARDNRVDVGSDTAQKVQIRWRQLAWIRSHLAFRIIVCSINPWPRNILEVGAAKPRTWEQDQRQYNWWYPSSIVLWSRFNNNTNDAMQWHRRIERHFPERAVVYMNGYLEHTQSWLKDSGRTHIDPEMIGITYGQFKSKHLIAWQVFDGKCPGRITTCRGSPRQFNRQDSRNAPYERPQTGIS